LPIALILAAIVPLQMASAWIAGLVALAFGSRLKERLLTGALRLPIDEVRADGVGGHLGRIIESDVFEGSLLAGAVAATAGLTDLAAAAIAAGISGLPHPGLIAAWAALVAAFGLLFLRSRGRWTQARLRLTSNLVERIVGHQTRLAQESPDRRHVGEDGELAAYHTVGRDMDSRLTWLSVLASRGWLAVGLAALVPAFMWGGAGETEFAVGLGAVLLAQRAFSQLANSLAILTDAIVGWRVLKPLSSAATLEAEPANRGAGLGLLARSAIVRSTERPRRDRVDQPLIEAHDLGFAYDGRPGAVLSRCSFVVHAGERILLEEDLALAEACLRDLELGPLLARMPNGLHQIVGETGWQLSHGERSRIYLARAILQNAELLILDESFAALDPHTLDVCWRVLTARQPTILVIAHP
jgi:ATP-binding cassette subfamily B protein